MTLEELQNKVLELTEKNNKLENDFKAISTQKEELDKELSSTKDLTSKRIQELQEHNQKLFLRVTYQKEEKVKSGEYTSKLLGDYAKSLSEEELTQLQKLEGGY